jgi:hypothetical protein
MPVTRDLPYSWYDTPNIHFCTIRDFVSLCDEIGCKVERHRSRRQRAADRPVDAVVVLELFGQQAVFLLRRQGQDPTIATLGTALEPKRKFVRPQPNSRPW